MLLNLNIFTNSLLHVCRDNKQTIELKSVKKDKIDTTESVADTVDSTDVVDETPPPLRKVSSHHYENIYLGEKNKYSKPKKSSSHQEVQPNTDEDHSLDYCPLNPVMAETSYYVTVNRKT